MTETQKQEELNNEALCTENSASQDTKPALAAVIKKNRIIILISVAVFLVGMGIFAALFGVPYIRYQNAVTMMEDGRHEEAMVAFYALDDFMHSAEFHRECRYRHANALFESEKYADAMVVFIDLGNYSDSTNMSLKCKYQIALSLKEAGEYEDAITKFEELGDFEDSKDKINECNYLIACDLMKNDNYKDAQTIFKSIKNYKDSKDKIKNCEYNIALDLIDEGEIVKAYEKLTKLKDYKKAKGKAAAIEGTYNRIMNKDKVFVTRRWQFESDRSTFNAEVIDENTIKFTMGGWHGLGDHSIEECIATWDPSTGRLYYSGSSCYHYAQTNYYEYTDGSGYFYYENGNLYWVNNKIPGYVTRFW